MNGPKFVIFDMDGVLFDTERLMLRCHETVAAEYHLPRVADVCRKCIGVNAERSQEIFSEYYGDQFPIHEIREKVLKLFHHTIDTEGVPVKPYATDLLQFLKESGCSLALASSTITETAKRELQQVGFYNYFNQIVGGDMVSRSKPSPDIFLAACEGLGCTPGDTYVIEDSVNGIRAAYAAGTMPLAVPDLISLPEDVRSMCVGAFSNLLEILEFFKSLIS